MANLIVSAKIARTARATFSPAPEDAHRTAHELQDVIGARLGGGTC